MILCRMKRRLQKENDGGPQLDNTGHVYDVTYKIASNRDATRRWASIRTRPSNA